MDINSWSYIIWYFYCALIDLHLPKQRTATRMDSSEYPSHIYTSWLASKYIEEAHCKYKDRDCDKKSKKC